MTTPFKDPHGNPVRMTKVVVKSPITPNRLSPGHPPDEHETPFVFFQIGTEYYISARTAVRNVHYQVAGNLFHHAFEMMFGGILLEKSDITPLLLKKRFGNHYLPVLWEEVKRAVPSPGRSHPWARFKRFIDDLQRWEEIRFGRFPRGLPKVLAVDYLRNPDAKRGQPDSDGYRVSLEDADELFAVLVGEMGWDQPAFVREKLIGVAAIRDYEWWNRYVIGEATYPRSFE